MHNLNVGGWERGNWWVEGVFASLSQSHSPPMQPELAWVRFDTPQSKMGRRGWCRVPRCGGVDSQDVVAQRLAIGGQSAVGWDGLGWYGTGRDAMEGKRVSNGESFRGEGVFHACTCSCRVFNKLCLVQVVTLQPDTSLIRTESAVLAWMDGHRKSGRHSLQNFGGQQLSTHTPPTESKLRATSSGTHR